MKIKIFVPAFELPENINEVRISKDASDLICKHDIKPRTKREYADER